MKKNIPVVEYRKELPYTRILLYFPGGSALEDDQTLGFAHLCEHLAFKVRVKEQGIAEFVESLGGGSNAYTSNDSIVFEITVLNKFVNETILFIEKIFKISLESITDVDFEEEKRVVLEEMAMYEDEPMENLYTTLMYNLFPSHTYGKRVIGEKRTLVPATKKDVARFMNERIMADPFLVIAGGYEKTPEIKINCSGKVTRNNLLKWKQEKSFEISHSQKKNYFIAGWRLPSQNGKIDAILRMIYAVTYGMDGGRLYNELVYENGVFDNLNISTFSGFQGSVFIQSAAFPSDKVKWRIEKWIDAWDKYRFTQIEAARAREVILSNEYFGSEGLGSMPDIMGKSYLLHGDTEKLEKDFFYEFMHLTADDLNAFKDEHLSFNKMIFGISKSQRCKVSPSDLIFPESKKFENDEVFEEIKRPGVKGVLKTLKGSSFLTGYLIKKSGTLSNIKGYPGSFKLFLDSLCTSADGMTREDTESYLDRFGITLSPVYGNNTGGIKFKVRDNFVKEAVEIIHKIFNNPIKEDDFNQEKLYSLSNISMMEEDPFYHIRNAIHYELFKGTPYENSVTGTVKGVTETKFDHIRKIRENFFKYNNFSVSVAGAVDMNVLSELIDNFVKKGIVKTHAFKFNSEKLNDRLLKIPLKGRKQTHIARVFRSPSVYDADFETMKLLENYMMGQKSPYFQELREKQGLVYSLDVSGMAGIVGGYVVFSAITSPDNTRRVIDSIEKSIDYLRNGSVDETFLTETKNGLITSYANSIVKSNFHAFNLALEEALGQTSGTYMRQPEIISAITKDELSGTAKKWLNDGMWIIAGEV